MRKLVILGYLSLILGKNYGLIAGLKGLMRKMVQNKKFSGIKNKVDLKVLKT